MPRHNIRCECGSRVTRMSIRYRKDGDDRPTSRIPFSGIGYYCVSCAKVHSLDEKITR